MNTEILKISIRHHAIYISDELLNKNGSGISESTTLLAANAAKLGFTFSEDLLKCLNSLHPVNQMKVLKTLEEVTGVSKNWTPLVKEWNIPTGESVKDHLMTFFANVLKRKKGTTLPCGHLIPNNTFPLDRYNGCPFCGTPFEFSKTTYQGQYSKLKVLTLWKDNDIQQFYSDLLLSKTALDATQTESLKGLLQHFGISQGVQIGIKETLMLVVDSLIELEQFETCTSLFKTPTDVLRYLWFKHTGFLQIIEPKTLIKRISKNHAHIARYADNSGLKKVQAKADLKLKYGRKECKMVATWLNNLPLSAAQSCEIMHPKRGMWIRFIRALRLVEYSKKTGFEKLANLLNTFHAEDYQTWQGRVNHYRLKCDAENTFKLLKERPGLFARSLFSNMLWFGDDLTIKHFEEIVNKIPARLVFSLNMYAGMYFIKQSSRIVKPLGGTAKRISTNSLVNIFSDDQLKQMQAKIEALTLKVMKQRFENVKSENKTIFIEKGLFNIPVSIGDRSETVQDLPSALMGTKFPIEGNNIRLFMQWGTGLLAQHLDMDLSCQVAYKDRTDFCSYSRLVIDGCKHSGDVIHIPNKIGTAEYIEIDVDRLAVAGAKYVTFTCNAYSNGSITPNLVVGWMDSKYPMKINNKSGVAYDPSCVQHQCRITQGLTKGLVFGVLDIVNNEVIWLEMPFGGQLVQGLDFRNIEALLNKLKSKLNIGNLLTLKAKAQNLTLVENLEEADEVYDLKWAVNSAKVTQLLIE